MFDALQQADCLIRVEGDGCWRPTPRSRRSTWAARSIQGVVLSRIDRLPEAHKLTLKVASVIGRTFALDLLAQTHPDQLSEDA